ncbi:hypothetical protein FN924_02560 [Radiobacillus deserti]|uniref:Mutator family transposase n=1 Tax=Radiobacillus deserti TaxID=2594883 RepID=A0A516KCN8_9BACI|nr:transposase [Radiobacillus deserti]QDP39173.1 hypothetical protein FN924_02560 [Radiobacillus deserti]
MISMGKIKRDPNSVELAEKIIEQYQPKSVEDMQNALKEIFGPMFESMLKGEMNHHLGYEPNDKNQKDTTNRRNGYGKKTLKTTAGEVDIAVPRDRDGSYEPQLIPKRKKDVSAIEDKVISMYAKGMSQRDISSTIEDIYGFYVSHEMISDITDAVLPELEEWQSRPLSNCYVFLFVDYLFQVISRRYENSSIILTSNKTFSQWGEVLGDGIIATAILDRLLHHSRVFSIDGQSFRMKNKATE